MFVQGLGSEWDLSDTPNVDNLKAELAAVEKELHAAEDTVAAESAPSVEVAPEVPADVTAPVPPTPAVDDGDLKYVVFQTVYTDDRQFERGEVITAGELPADVMSTLSYLGVLGPEGSAEVEPVLVPNVRQELVTPELAEKLATAGSK